MFHITKMFCTFAPSEFNFFSTKSYMTQFDKLYDTICEYDHEDENLNKTARKLLGGYDVFTKTPSTSLRSLSAVWTAEYKSWEKTQRMGWVAVVKHKNNEDKYGNSHLLKIKKIVKFLKSLAEDDPALERKWKIINRRTAIHSLIIFNEAVSRKDSKYELHVFVKDYYGVKDGVKECENKKYCEMKGYLESTFDAYRQAKFSTANEKYVKEDFRFKPKEKINVF
jgi:hypothetical protein